LRKTALIFVFCALFPATALATSQIREYVVYKGQEERMASEPLEAYFDAEHPRPDNVLRGSCSACWRGYVGYWEIRGDRLFLVRLDECHCKDSEADIPLGAVFPGQTGPIFAEWFTGTLVLTKGLLLHYVHMEYSSTWSLEIHLEFREGRLVRETEIDNTGKPAEPESPAPVSPTAPSSH